MWLDAQMSQMLARGALPEGIGSAAKAFEDQTPTPAEGEPYREAGFKRRQPRRCPSCSAPLRRGAVATFEFDVCSSHGTWFDRNKLHPVSAIMREKEQAAGQFLREIGRWSWMRRKAAAWSQSWFVRALGWPIQ
jgi:Zn-finger nucleic acid-binding protein